IMHLNRGWPVGENAEPSMLRVALEIDQDVDAIVTNQFRGVLVGKRLAVSEHVHAGNHALAFLAVVGSAIPIAINLKTGAVMALEQAGYQEGRRMMVEVGGQVADP